MIFLENLWHLSLELAPWLFVGTIVASLLHIWLPKDFVSRRLGGGGPGDVARAVAFGVPLPLCSCGAIPAALSLKKEGASQGASVGFLIATPQTGMDSILVTASMLGWPFALYKIVAALVTGFVGGVLVDRVGQNASAEPEPSVHDHHSGPQWREAVRYGIDELLYPIWGWLVVGMIVSAAMSTWIPQDQYAMFSAAGIWTLFLTIGISLPLYVCATASVPVAASLVAAGFPEGAALVFLMVGPATNIATIGAVNRVFGARVVAVYLSVVVFGSVGFGMVFDTFWGLEASNVMVHEHHGSPLTIVSAILLAMMLVWFAGRDLSAKVRTQGPAAGEETVALTVSGLTCGGCVRKLTTGLEEVDGVRSVHVDLESGETQVHGTSLNASVLEAAVTSSGFSVQATA
jgi:hypothetical protein